MRLAFVKKLMLFVVINMFLFASACEGTRKKDDQIQDEKREIKASTFMALNTIASRFDPPDGFIRKTEKVQSFAHYLRHFPLYPVGREVRYFNGRSKTYQGHHVAVLDIDVGTKDLQQCADAVMRLRAEYLYSQKNYDEIAFHFVSGFNATYTDWRKGKRVNVVGNKVNWYQTNKPSEGRASFKSYLETVFMYAGTPSLEKELKPKILSKIEIGDVFIKGGSPGHAIIVVDVAVKDDSKDKVFLLAQSYMPAQDIHILKNPMNSELSPWYSVADIDNEVITPEWNFKRSDLRSF